MTPDAGSIRIVPELRAVHLERHRLGTPAHLLFLDTNYDLDGTPLSDGVERSTVLGALVRFVTTAATTLEVPEPLWMRFWPRHVVLAVGFKVAGALRGRTHRVVTYAMENNDLAVLVGGERSVPTWLVRAVAGLVGLVARLTLDRICFASDASRSTYSALPFIGHVEQDTVLELPSSIATRAQPTPLSCVFVGVMEVRKGVRELMAAWSIVESVLPGARLELVGPGPLAHEVAAWAAESPSTRRFVGRLPRAEATSVVRGCSVLVAPSVPDGRWKEQIGLPIKEALATGLTVVTSDQSGLAEWLRSHRHEVVGLAGPGTLRHRLASALVRALRAPLDRDAVRASLPAQDGRLVADAWLHEARSVDRTVRDVVIVNTLGGALHHYTRGLAATLGQSAARVSVIEVDEPSVSGGSGLGWLRRYCGALAEARRTARGSGARVIVTWPVLGYLDRLLMRAVLGRRTGSALVMHDPRPLVHARGYGRGARLLGSLGGGVALVVHSAAAERAVREQCASTVPVVLPHPVLPRGAGSVAELDRGTARPTVRVLGQFKPDRDVELLAEIATELGVTHRLEVVGRRWPEIPGWDVSDEFVTEDRLEHLIATADAIVVPYKRFFQSGIAIRALELGTPAVGPAGSSIADLYPDDRYLASDSTASWCESIVAATTASPQETRALAVRADRAARAAWSEWLGSDAAAVS